MGVPLSMRGQGTPLSQDQDHVLEIVGILTSILQGVLPPQDIVRTVIEMRNIHHLAEDILVPLLIPEVIAEVTGHQCQTVAAIMGAERTHHLATALVFLA